MNRLLLFFVIKAWLLLPSQQCFAGDTTRYNNLYLHWKSKQQQIVLGHFNATLKRVTEKSFPINTITKADIHQWLGSYKQNAILIFHCMWGEIQSFHRTKYLKPINQVLQTDIDTSQTVISIIWQSGGLSYKSNAEAADGKGEQLATVIGWIKDCFEGDINTLSHSMGNRFFEGVVRADTLSKKKYKNTILFSADISNASTDADFIRCQHAAENLYIYIHHKDRMLLVSKWLNRCARLGRTGPKPNLQNSHIIVVDMTLHTQPSLSNHTHTDNEWVMEQMKQQLTK